MRAGILTFGEAAALAFAPLADALRAENVDVVPADASPDARDAAQTLARADCDGVLFVLNESAPAHTVLEAALHLAATPLLLVGLEAARAPAAGLLTEVGARFAQSAQNSTPAAAAAEVLAWLRENAKGERQAGIEAARKLYGQRVSADPPPPDALRWTRQFGVIFTADEARADFAVLSGSDPHAALTRQMLRLVAGSEAADTVVIVPVTDALFTEPDENDDLPATFARLEQSGGEFMCLVARGVLARDGQSPRLDAERDAVPGTGGHLCALPGEHVGALRACCDTLDIALTLI